MTDSGRAVFGKGSFGRPVAIVAAMLLLGWFLLGSITYQPICETRVVAADLRHFSAPFDGKLATVHVSPGQHVPAGTVLAEFDTAALRLERNAIEQQLSSVNVELRQAVAAEDMAQAALARSQLGVLMAQARSLNRRIETAQIVAPAAGTVIIADLQQRVGQVFPQGESLLQFAADGDWLLEIQVPDDIVNYVSANQTGTFASASAPTGRFSFTIDHVDGAAEVIEDRNVFIARAELKDHPDWMMSGMEGTAQLTTVERPVWWVVLHGAIDWARMNFWI